MIKLLIIVLLVGVLVSLFSGLTFLFKDSERNDSRRTLYALGVRITLAAALLATIGYGLYSGQLKMGSNAPWAKRHVTIDPRNLDDIDEHEQAHPDDVDEVPIPR